MLRLLFSHGNDVIWCVTLLRLCRSFYYYSMVYIARKAEPKAVEIQVTIKELNRTQFKNQVSGISDEMKKWSFDPSSYGVLCFANLRTVPWHKILEFLYFIPKEAMTNTNLNFFEYERKWILQNFSFACSKVCFVQTLHMTRHSWMTP